MNKIVITALLFLSSMAYSQKESKDYTFFEKSNQNSMASDSDAMSTPSEPGDPAPIDDYIPLLVAAGIGMAVYFGRKKYVLTK